MVSLGAIALLPALVGPIQEPKPQPSRFENAQLLASLPGVMLDRRLHGVGIANSLARSKHLQARIMWIDATANIDRYNTEQKIVELVAKIADSGFNTIVFDVKPISGQVVYNSKIAPKLTEWRDRKLPADFDPLPVFVREAHAHKLQLFTCLNAFSEGHALFKSGPGYEHVDWQTTLYEPVVFAQIGNFRKTVQGASGQLLTTEDQFTMRVDEAFNKLSPMSSGYLSAFNDASMLPKRLAQGFAVTVDARGRFVDGFEILPGVPLPTLPTGGVMLIAQGARAMSLRTASINPGRISFDVEANLVPISERPSQQYPLITDPTNPDVLQRNLDIVNELVSNYQIDGVLYDDRLRFSGMSGDFGPNFRAAFEKWLGRRVARWPEDVYQITFTPNLVRGLRPGIDYENWMLFRALTMKRYVQSVSKTIKGIRPTAQFGVYAGSWYGEYPTFGSNYGSPDLDGGFWFLTPEYQKTGFAESLDFLITGCYYPTATIYDAMRIGKGIGVTIESAASLSNRVANDSTWTYAGIALDQFKNDPQGLMNALQASCGASQGVMVFDLSHGIEPMWPIFKQAFSQPKLAPHSNLANLKELRRQKAVAAKNGVKRPPVIVSTGQAGAGH